MPGLATDEDSSNSSSISKEAGGSAAEPSLVVGDRVGLIEALPYLKTSDPMPMLRPPDLVDPEEIGQVVEIRALGTVAVKFRRGTFLIDAHQLTPRFPQEGQDSSL